MLAFLERFSRIRFSFNHKDKNKLLSNKKVAFNDL